MAEDGDCTRPLARQASSRNDPSAADDGPGLLFLTIKAVGGFGGTCQAMDAVRKLCERGVQLKAATTRGEIGGTSRLVEAGRPPFSYKQRSTGQSLQRQACPTSAAVMLFVRLPMSGARERRRGDASLLGLWSPAASFHFWQVAVCTITIEQYPNATWAAPALFIFSVGSSPLSGFPSTKRRLDSAEMFRQWHTRQHNRKHKTRCFLPPLKHRLRQKGVHLGSTERQRERWDECVTEALWRREPRTLHPAAHRTVNKMAKGKTQDAEAGESDAWSKRCRNCALCRPHFKTSDQAQPAKSLARRSLPSCLSFPFSIFRLCL